MKLLLATLVVMVSTAALADGKFTCNFVGEEKGAKVCQCAPPTGWTAVGGQQTVPDNK